MYGSDRITQRGLDALEEHFIKKYKSHYSNLNGGCNVLLGTANGFGSTNPMCDKEIINKMREKKKGKYRGKNCYWYNKHLSDETKKKLGDLARERFAKGKHPSLGRKMSAESKKKMRLAASKRDKSTYAHGFKRTNEQKEKIRNGLLRYYANVSKQS